MSRHSREDGIAWIRAGIKGGQYFKYDGKIMQFADFNKTIGELISVGVHSLPKHSRSYVCFWTLVMRYFSPVISGIDTEWDL